VYAKHGIKVKTHNENMTNSTARSPAPETIFRHYQPTGCDRESMKTYTAPFTVLSFKKRLNWKVNFVTGPNSVNAKSFLWLGLCQVITCQPIELESCSNPLKKQKVF